MNQKPLPHPPENHLKAVCLSKGVEKMDARRGAGVSERLHASGVYSSCERINRNERLNSCKKGVPEGVQGATGKPSAKPILRSQLLVSEHRRDQEFATPSTSDRVHYSKKWLCRFFESHSHAEKCPGRTSFKAHMAVLQPSLA